MTTLNIGNQAYNSQDVAHKVQSDIQFLESRIALLREQTNPNPQVLQIYAQMLESRQAGLHERTYASERVVAFDLHAATGDGRQAEREQRRARNSPFHRSLLRARAAHRERDGRVAGHHAAVYGRVTRGGEWRRRRRKK